MHRRQTKSFGSARIQTLTHSSWDIAAQSCNNWHCGNTIPETRRRLPSERICKNEALLVHQRKKQQGRVNHLAFHSWTNQHRAHPTLPLSVGLPVLAGLCDPPNGLGATRPKNMSHSDQTESPSKDWSLKKWWWWFSISPCSDSRIFKIVQGTVPWKKGEQSVPLSYKNLSFTSAHRRRWIRGNESDTPQQFKDWVDHDMYDLRWYNYDLMSI